MARKLIQRLTIASVRRITILYLEETNGLPANVIEENFDHCLRIPMTDKVRSLNLSNTAAILIYEAFRQQNYPGLDLEIVY